MDNKNNYDALYKPLSLTSSFWKGGEGVHQDTNRLKEAIIGRNNFVKIDWLEKALKASSKIAHVIRTDGGRATAFLVDERLILTNNHVFPTIEVATGARLEFDYCDGKTTESWECQPDRTFVTDKKLDFSLVYAKPLSEELFYQGRGFLRLSANVIPPKINEGVNIIQHPQGRTMEIAFRDNQCKYVDHEKIQYLTDTERGSSGSPVFNDRFEVVALHKQYQEDPSYSKDEDSTCWYRNEGSRIDQIIKHIQNELSY